jgi:glycosyltransferase involved in cell wall biosynthesis
MTDPRMLSLRELVNFRVSAYRCVDQLNAFSDIPPSVDKLEHELVNSSTVVFATAEDLLNKLREWRQDLEFLPNAAEIDHFRLPADEPQLLNAIARPRVLYVGALGEWFDTALVRAMAVRMPEVSFVIVGPKRRSLTEIGAVSNIHLLGPQPYHSVPGYMQHCDVAIIPFTTSTLSRAVNPIKLYEYLAAGMPVVCSDLPEVTRSELPVRIAKGTEQFETAIREAFKVSAGERSSLQQSVEKYSWKSRFRQIAHVLKSRSELDLIVP